ncbi:MAG: BatD family protein [Euryarchaeota archaeon]|nr:BatD family protein [Euryarchaeota archaeon]
MMGLDQLKKKVYTIVLVLVIASPYFAEEVLGAEWTIEGTIVDGNGEGIEGATVVAIGWGLDAEDYDTTTDSDGEFSLTVEEGDYFFRVTAEGYTGYSTRLEDDDTPPDTIHLTKTAVYKELYTRWMEIGDLRAVGDYTIVLFDISKRSWEHARTQMFPDKVYFQVFREGNFIDEHIIDFYNYSFTVQEVLKVEMLSIADRDSDGDFEAELRFSSREQPSISLSDFTLYDDIVIKEKNLDTNATVELDGEEYNATTENGVFEIDLNKNNILDPYESFNVGDSFATEPGPCISKRSYRILDIDPSGGIVTVIPEVRELMRKEDFDLDKMKEMKETVPTSGEELYMYALIENVGNFKASDVVISVDHAGYELLNYCDISSDNIPVGDMEPKKDSNIKKVLLLRLKAPSVSYEEYYPITIDANYKMEYENEEGEFVEEKFQKTFKQDKNVYPKTVQLRINQFVTYKELLPGDESSVTITVENIGDVTARDLEIVDFIPEGLALIDGEASKTVETLSPGESTQFTYRMKAEELGEYDLITKVRYTDQRGERHEKQSSPVPIIVYKEFPRLEVKKNMDKTSIVFNEHIIVVLTVTNTGNKPAKDIVIVDTIPEGFSLTSSKEEEVTGDVNVFKINRMDPNQKEIFSYVIKADDPGKHTMKGCKVKYSDFEDNHFEYESSDINIDVSGLPELDLSYSVSREGIKDGELLTVIGKVTNTGNGLAKDIWVENKFNKGELVEGELVKEIDALKPCDHYKYKFTVRVPVSSTAYDFIVDTEHVYYDILGNEYPEKKKLLQFTQKIDAKKPKVELGRSIEKMIIKNNKYYVDSGYSFIITFLIRNTGSADAVDLVLEEPLPAGFEIVDGTNRWGGDLKLGESKEIVYTAHGDVGGVYTLTPSAYFKDKWGVSYSGTGKRLKFTVRGLNITKAISSNEVSEGDPVKITITIKNYGNAEMKDILVEDSIPEGFELVGGELTAEKDVLEGGHSMNLSYTLKALFSGDYTLKKAKVSWKNPYGESRQLESDEYNVSIIELTPPPTSVAPTTTPPKITIVEKYASTALLILVAILLLIIAIIGIGVYSKRRSEKKGEELFEELEISEEELSEEESLEDQWFSEGEEEEAPEPDTEDIFEGADLIEEEEEEQDEYRNAPDSIKKVLEWQEKEEKRTEKAEKKETKKKERFETDDEISDDMTPREVLKGKKKEKKDDEDH